MSSEKILKGGCGVVAYPQNRRPGCMGGWLWVAGLVMLAVFVSGAWGQEEEAGVRRRTFWKAVLPGGEYVVPHQAVASFSMSSYVVNGALRVQEVSIDTVGSVQGRFYYIEPLEPESPAPFGGGQAALDALKGHLEELQERTGIARKRQEVSKTHPQTTHAHTVEFALPDAASLVRLYRSFEDSWMRGRTQTFQLEKAQEK